MKHGKGRRPMDRPNEGPSTGIDPYMATYDPELFGDLLPNVAEASHHTSNKAWSAVKHSTRLVDSHPPTDENLLRSRQHTRRAHSPLEQVAHTNPRTKAHGPPILRSKSTGYPPEPPMCGLNVEISSVELPKATPKASQAGQGLRGKGSFDQQYESQEHAPKKAAGQEMHDKSPPMPKQQITMPELGDNEGLLPYVPPIEVVPPPSTVFPVLRRVKGTQLSLKDLGPPKYTPEDRSRFCRTYREDPESLKNLIAYGILLNPSLGSKELNRLLYNAFGARTAEVCRLFNCNGLQGTAIKILASYKMANSPGDPGAQPTTGSLQQALGGADSPSQLGDQGISVPSDSEQGKRLESVLVGSANKVNPPRSLPMAVPPPPPKCNKEKTSSSAPLCKAASTQTPCWPLQKEDFPTKTKTNSPKSPTPQIPCLSHNEDHTGLPQKHHQWIPPQTPTSECMVIPDPTPGGNFDISPTTPPNTSTISPSPVHPPPNRLISSQMLQEVEDNSTVQSNRHEGDSAPATRLHPAPAGKKTKGLETQAAQTQEHKLGNSSPTLPNQTSDPSPPHPNTKATTNQPSPPHPEEQLQEAPIPGSSQSPTKYGTCQQTSPQEWDIVMWRIPTNLTPQEREFSRQCTRSFPPTTKKRNFHPISAALMARCPIGGGSCKHSLINLNNPKGSAYTHFSIHHRTGAHYNIKIEGVRNHFLYTSFPGPSPPPSNQQGANSFAYQYTEETAKAQRRRQRLYPRLTGKAKNTPAALAAKLPINIEDLLSGSLQPAPVSTDPSNSQGPSDHKLGDADKQGATTNHPVETAPPPSPSPGAEPPVETT